MSAEDFEVIHDGREVQLSKTIKSLIDVHTVESVLRAIESFCRDKGGQAMLQYKDADTAKTWRTQANSVGYVASLAKNRGL